MPKEYYVSILYSSLVQWRRCSSIKAAREGVSVWNGEIHSLSSRQCWKGKLQLASLGITITIITCVGISASGCYCIWKSAYKVMRCYYLQLSMESIFFLPCSLDPAILFLFVPWYVAAAVGPIMYVLVGIYLLLGNYFKYAKIFRSVVSLIHIR